MNKKGQTSIIALVVSIIVFILAVLSKDLYTKFIFGLAVLLFILYLFFDVILNRQLKIGKFRFDLFPPIILFLLYLLLKAIGIYIK